MPTLNTSSPPVERRVSGVAVARRRARPRRTKRTSVIVIRRVPITGARAGKCGGRREIGIAPVAGQGRGAAPTGIEAVAAGRNVARLLRWIAAIAEVVVGRAVGGRPVMRHDIRAVAAVIAAHCPGLGGKGGGEQHGGEGQFDQGFHGFEFLVCCCWRFILNRLHPLHRKRRRASYNFLFNHG